MLCLLIVIALAGCGKEKGTKTEGEPLRWPGRVFIKNDMKSTISYELKEYSIHWIKVGDEVYARWMFLASYSGEVKPQEVRDGTEKALDGGNKIKYTVETAEESHSGEFIINDTMSIWVYRRDGRLRVQIL